MSEPLDVLRANTEEIFRALADCADDFVCLATSHGEPFYLNMAARRIVGFDDDEQALPVSLHEYYGEESWQELRDVAVPAVNRTGRWEGRSWLRNVKTGQTSEMTTLMLRLKTQSERPTCLAILHRQGMAPSEVPAALSGGQARTHAILESSLDPIITIDHRGVITEFNRAAEQAFGYPRGKVLGTRPAEVLFPPTMSAGHRERIERYLSAGEGSMLGKRIEVMAVRANGENFPAEMAMTISHERGEPELTLFVRDISLRRKAEEEQARYAAELKRSNADLEQFAYVASHDLQEPLRKIRTFSDRLEMKCAEALDETGRECIERMQSAAARMQLLIDGLLTLSRVTTRSKGFVAVDLAEVAGEVVSDLEVQIERSGGSVEVGKLPMIQADPLQMRQLFQNLIGNGIKFCRVDEPPTVRVEGRFVEGRQQRHAVGAAAAGSDAVVGGQVRITFEDNGIGFDEQHKERIFGIFQRLHPRDVYEGAGIGLAICRKIVEHHGGEISVRSTPGKGSVFEVLLPAVQPGRKKF
jgi:two-component system, LuxR family, sensor kinase FixL